MARAGTVREDIHPKVNREDPQTFQRRKAAHTLRTEIITALIPVALEAQGQVRNQDSKKVRENYSKSRIPYPAKPQLSMRMG